MKRYSSEDLVLLAYADSEKVRQIKEYLHKHLEPNVSDLRLDNALYWRMVLNVYFLDKSPEMVMAAVQVFFEIMEAIPLRGDESLNSIEKARLIRDVERRLEDIVGNGWGGRRKTRLYEFTQQQKQEFGLGPSLVDSVTDLARASIRKLKGVFVQERTKEAERKDFPHWSELQVLFRMYSEKFRMRATYDVAIQLRHEDQDLLEILDQIHLLERTDIYDCRFDGYIYDNWRRLADDVFYYFDEPGTNSSIIYRDYERASSERRGLIRDVLKTVVQEYEEEIVRPDKKTPYRG